MPSEPHCPDCGCEMEYDEVDIGVGVMRGPAACRNCYEKLQLDAAFAELMRAVPDEEDGGTP